LSPFSNIAFQNRFNLLIRYGFAPLHAKRKRNRYLNSTQPERFTQQVILSSAGADVVNFSGLAVPVFLIAGILNALEHDAKIKVNGDIAWRREF